MLKLFIINIIISLISLNIYSNAFQWDFPANREWECEFCDDIKDKNVIFGLIRHALYHESRETYLNFDHSWIDRLLRVNSLVNIKNIHRSKLASLKLEEHINPSESYNDEKYQIVISLGIVNISICIYLSIVIIYQHHQYY
jgi:hypothetical protein